MARLAAPLGDTTVAASASSRISRSSHAACRGPGVGIGTHRYSGQSARRRNNRIRSHPQRRARCFIGADEADRRYDDRPPRKCNSIVRVSGQRRRRRHDAVAFGRSERAAATVHDDDYDPSARLHGTSDKSSRAAPQCYRRNRHRSQRNDERTDSRRADSPGSTANRSKLRSRPTTPAMRAAHFILIRSNGSPRKAAPIA